MQRRHVIQTLAVVAALCLGYAVYAVAWQWGLWPRRVIMTRTIETEDGTKLKTRHYWQSTRPYFRILEGRGSWRNYEDEAIWEVELPSGRWIDCEQADCLAAYEKAMQ